MVPDNNQHEAPDASVRGEGFGDVIASAARKSGLGLAADGRIPGGRDLLRAVGGIRGIAEAVLPGLAFLIIFAFGGGLPLALGVSVGIAVIFTILRIVTRSAATQAVAGLVGAGASAGLALITGEGENNFLLGLITNAVYGAVLLVSMVVRWPLLGVAIGFLMGDGTSWQKDRMKRRVMQWITACWVAMFVLRLAVQLPLYFASAVEPLAAAKLAMGIPLYVPLLLLSWVMTRSVYGQRTPDVAVELSRRQDK